jgi:hypothetical protein
MTSKNPEGAKERMRRHRRIESVSVLGAVARLSPLAFHRYATDFLRATEAVEPSDHPFSPVASYLASRTIELALKAFLSARGYTFEQLAREPLGHHLDALLREAQQNGLSEHVRLDDASVAEVVSASRYYSEKVLEYPSVWEALNGYPDKPQPFVLLRTARTLVLGLEKPCLDAT